MAASRVVIIGGGFAGTQCARVLRHKLQSRHCEIVLFNPENHMVFHPLLPEVAGASLNSDAVGASLRQMLPGVRCRTEEVTAVDLHAAELTYDGHDGRSYSLAYDHVVFACGRAVNLATVPGMADHAFPLKTLGDALALRVHVMHQLEKADASDDPERRRWLLSFVVVGGGFTGVEAAGELNDLVRSSLRVFPRLTHEELTVTIVHSGAQLLPEISEGLRDAARRCMERARIRI